MMQAARVHLNTGKAAYKSGEYAVARKEYEQAYAILPLPEYLRNLAKIADKQGQLGDAIRYAEKYLAADPAASDAQDMTVYLADLLARQERVPPPPSAHPGSGDQPSPRKPGLAAPLAIAGSGLLVLAIGGGLGFASLNAQQQFTDATGSGGAYWTEVQATYNQGTALNLGAIVLDAVGGVGLAAGLVWTGYVLYQRKHRPAQPGVREPALANQAR